MFCSAPAGPNIKINDKPDFDDFGLFFPLAYDLLITNVEENNGIWIFCATSFNLGRVDKHRE